MRQNNQQGLFLSLLVAVLFMPLSPTQADSVKSCLEMSSTNPLSDSDSKIIQLSDPLEMTFAWNQVDPDVHFDIYIALQFPSTMEDIQLRFLDTAGNFHQTVEPYLIDQQAWNGKITVLKYEKLPFANVRLDQLSGIGQYAFYAVVVPKGTEKQNVLNPAYWISDLCSEKVFVTRTR